MTVKTAVSRFQIHDELTAPDESAPLIKSIQAAGGAVTKFVGVLAGAPAVLRAYTRMRSELRVYNSGMHRAAFALPTFVQTLLQLTDRDDPPSTADLRTAGHPLPGVVA